MDFGDPDKPPKYLFIRGVFTADCKSIDQILEEQLLGEAEPEAPLKMYDKMPDTYRGLEQWPLSVNIWCWHCSRTFSSVPVFVPKSIEKSESKYLMATEGCFCSFPCASAYTDQKYPRLKVNAEKKNMLKFLFNQMMKRDIDIIPSAPSKYEMVHFGGNLMPSEFDKIVASLIQDSN